MVLRTILKVPGHQEQADTAGTGFGALRPREQHYHFGVGIGAEPFLAGQTPMIAFLHSCGSELADVGAAFLLGHELAALGQLAHVGLGQAIEIFCLQRIAAEIRQQLGAAVGDIDRAAEAELGLIEQKRKCVLGDNRVSVAPAQNALADRHRVNAELRERDLLQFAIGRVIFDPLHVAAEAVARVQDRRVAIGEARAFIEMTTGERTQPVKMRLDMVEDRLGQMNPQQVGQCRIGAVEIHPRRIRRQQSGLASTTCHTRSG